MMATSMPWAPIIAFMVASPLTSPEGLVYSAGLFGWPFALAFYLASIILGLAAGWVAAAFERHGWLANQSRFVEPVSAPCACSASNQTPIATGRVFGLAAPCACAGALPFALASSCGCREAETISGGTHNSSCPAQSTAAAAPQKPSVTPVIFLKELYSSGQQLLVMFVGFAFIGYMLNGLIPTSWVAAVFGGGKIYNVPLAATLGLPLYINSEASLPLVRALLDNGMSQGAALAFLIAGAGTSIGAITGALAIARWRVVALVVGILWLGAILSGFAFNLLLMLKVF
jgi:uncharacterized membrane protein YraQ (UPF0718 family)